MSNSICQTSLSYLRLLKTLLISKNYINQLAELLQRAAAFRQQVPRNNHNDVDPPQPRPNLRRQGLFDNRADMYNQNEDDQNN